MPFTFLAIDDYSVGLNEMRDACAEFKRVFQLEGNRSEALIAETIVDLLLEKHDVHIYSASHPFNRFASMGKSEKDNLRALRNAVFERFQDVSSVRSYIPGFFHESGVNFDDLAELFDAFMEWVDSCTENDDDEDSDSESQSSEDESQGSQDSEDESQSQGSQDD
jgi:hypothetical protein